jgi:DNA-binding transcriptional regulator LsrR (DeoR family)
MKIILIIGQRSPQRLLITLPDRKAIENVIALVSRQQHSQAIISALTSGSFEKEITADQAHNTAADMILSEHSASWDLTK